MKNLCRSYAATVTPARTQEPRLQQNSQTAEVIEAQCKNHDVENTLQQLGKVIKSPR